MRTKKQRKHTLLHKVQCNSCGKFARIEILPNGKNKQGWQYFGRLCINYLKTDKFFWRVPADPKKWSIENWEKVPNKEYDKKEKRKYAEYWECPGCCSAPP
jgi:hypothetical protein